MRIRKDRERFLKFIDGRTFKYQGKDYLVAHKNFFDEIISDLIRNGFLEEAGWLSQIVKKGERRKMPGIVPVLGGRVTTYEILKPLKF